MEQTEFFSIPISPHKSSYSIYDEYLDISSQEYEISNDGFPLNLSVKYLEESVCILRIFLDEEDIYASWSLDWIICVLNKIRKILYHHLVDHVFSSYGFSEKDFVFSEHELSVDFTRYLQNHSDTIETFISGFRSDILHQSVVLYDIFASEFVSGVVGSAHDLINSLDFDDVFRELFSSRFLFLRVIGNGAFSSVYLTLDIRSGRLLASKKTDFIDKSVSFQVVKKKHFIHEAFVLSCLDHKNIVSLIFTAVSNRMGFIITELLSKKTLRDVLESTPSGCLPFFSEKDICALDIMIELLSALSELHGKEVPIVHRDIKPENISLNKEGIKLIDFGISLSLFGNGHSSFQKNIFLSDKFCFLGNLDKDFPDANAVNNYFENCNSVLSCTPVYAPPEIIDCYSLPTTAYDIYSAGVVFYEMLSGKYPVFGDMLQVIAFHKNSDLKPLCVSTFHGSLPDNIVGMIMNRMLCRDPNLRASAEDLYHELLNVKRRLLV